MLCSVVQCIANIIFTYVCCTIISTSAWLRDCIIIRMHDSFSFPSCLIIYHSMHVESHKIKFYEYIV